MDDLDRRIAILENELVELRILQIIRDKKVDDFDVGWLRKHNPAIQNVPRLTLKIALLGLVSKGKLLKNRSPGPRGRGYGPGKTTYVVPYIPQPDNPILDPLI